MPKCLGFSSSQQPRSSGLLLRLEALTGSIERASYRITWVKSTDRRDPGEMALSRKAIMVILNHAIRSGSLRGLLQELQASKPTDSAFPPVVVGIGDSSLASPIESQLQPVITLACLLGVPVVPDIPTALAVKSESATKLESTSHQSKASKSE